jgi:hypothetical protein
MKNLTFLFVFLLSMFSGFAKDVSIKVANENKMSMNLWIGSIPSKSNYYSDDEIVQLHDQLKITPYRRKLSAGRKVQINQKGLSNNHILILYGVFEGGSRTAVKRFYVKELENRFTITFEEIKVYRPNRSYVNIIRELSKTDDLAEGFPISNTDMIGMFLLYDVNSEDYHNVYVMKPSIQLKVEDSDVQSNEVSDFIHKDAKTAYMSLDGKIVRNIPEETEDVYTEIAFPGYSERDKLFGDQDFRFLTWRITNTHNKEVTLGKTQFTPLYNSCSDADKNTVYRKYMSQVNKDVEANYHLFYVSSIRSSDKIEIVSRGYDAIKDYEELLDEDIKTSNGAYRLNDQEEVMVSHENMTSYVKCHDITPLMYYIVAKNGNFDETEFEADNLSSLYESLGNYLELPELDADAISLSDPGYTISTIKNNLSAPEILQKIEEKLKQDLPVPIPSKAVMSADKKMDSMKTR